MTAGRLVNDVLNAMSRHGDEDSIRKVWDILRLELNEMCREFSVSELRTKTTIDFSSSSYSTGMLLPSNLAGIDMVRDSDGLEYIERNRADIENKEYMYRYYRYNTSADGLFFGTDGIVSNGGSAFTSASLVTRIADTTTDPDAVDGEWVRFGEEESWYLMSTDTSPFSFTPVYYGPPITQGDFYVRPPETQRIVLLDKAEDALTERSVDVHYWTYPRGIYRPSDRIPLASTEALTLRILRRMPEAKDRRPVNQNEVDKAMDKLKKLTPNFPRSPAARGEDNQPIDFDTNPFDTRSE